MATVREELRKHPMIVRRLLTADNNFPRYRDALEQELKRQVADARYRVAAGVSDIVPGALRVDWVERMRELKRAYLLPMVAMAYDMTDAELTGKADVEIDIRDILTQHEVGRVDRWILRTSEYETRESAARLQAEFEKAAAYWNAERGVGMTIRQLRREIVASFADAALPMTVSRANMLARTGTIWSFNEGAQARYSSAGFATKEWLATEDDLTCDYCMEMDGKTVEMDGEFAEAGAGVPSRDPSVQRRLSIPSGLGVEHPPLHPYCRCTIVPVIEEL